jgi:hypothetical protein
MATSAVVETAYRTDEPVLLARLGTLLAKRAEAKVDIDAVLRVRQRRRARIVAGKLGVSGALLAFAIAALEALSSHSPWTGSALGLATAAFMGTVTAAIVVYGVWIADPAGALEREQDRFCRAEGPLREEVDRLSSDRDVWRLREEVARLERASVFFPLAAAGLLGPITSHFFVGLLVSVVAGGSHYVRAFDFWILASLVLVGLSHVALVFRTRGLARALASVPDADLTRETSRFAWRTVLWTTLWACVPGILLWGIPVVLSLATGALLIPMAFGRAAQVVRLERARLGLPSPPSPPT